ncbi:hypothetical protein [Streptomyces violascens]|uniref:hypothetical protein n=1 Tax=Streptomyces violascens TaxID=67381 RepID=UPI00367F1979
MPVLRAHRIDQTSELPSPSQILSTRFTTELDQWRTQAHTDWHALRGQAQLPTTNQLPDYLLDRYAFRAYMRARFGLHIKDRFSKPIAPQMGSWVQRTQTGLRGVPSLGIAPVKLNDPVVVTPQLRDLLDRWRTYLSGFGITYASHLYQPPENTTWLDFYQRSALYPFFPPAFGPSFAEKMAEQQRRRVMETHDLSDIMGLYVLILQAHEDTHRAQKGEPLLCEFTLALLWCRFLDENNLWHLQRNEDSGRSFNDEEPYLRRLQIAESELRALFHDTADGVQDIAGTHAYDDVALAGWLFDAHLMTYREYLELVTRCLGGHPIRSKLDILIREFLSRLTATGA